MSVGERILKIRQHLAKLEAEIQWHLFPDTVYIAVRGGSTPGHG